ncbi:transmembrane 132C [Pelobates cultripes]|uniref:Transmembrane 132C n=1 Tax=Pelobates cultripes TaxID=61616 RepID=A0AAD1S9H4_PELCU|nr:transmembrane 132C [Pelobates cultripes]
MGTLGICNWTTLQHLGSVISLILGMLFCKVTQSRGIPDNFQRFSASPSYLPVTYRIESAETTFLLKELSQDFMRNSSLQSRIESFFIHKARRTPILNASYGPFSAEQGIPEDLLLNSRVFGSTKFTFNWMLKAYIINDKVYPNKPKVQVLFYIAGRDWDNYSATEKLPCLKLFAFRETREAKGSCRLQGILGLCVAELEFLPSWFNSPPVTSRKRNFDLSEGIPIELYFSIQSEEEKMECTPEEARKGNAIRQGKDSTEDIVAHLQRIGTINLYRTPENAPVTELRLDNQVALWLPSKPAKQGEILQVYVTVANNSTMDQFTLRYSVTFESTLNLTRFSVIIR